MIGQYNTKEEISNQSQNRSEEPRDTNTAADWLASDHVVKNNNTAFKSKLEKSLSPPKNVSYEESLKGLALIPTAHSVTPSVTPSGVELPVPDITIRAATSVSSVGVGFGGADNCGFYGGTGVSMVCYETRGGSAKSGKDFIGSSGTLVSLNFWKRTHVIKVFLGAFYTCNT